MSADWQVHTGAALEVLASLAAESVQTCITSPPYWGLRDYGDEGQEWPEVTYSPMSGLSSVLIPACNVPLGLESDPAEYVGHLVSVFREVGRVLRDDGTLWLNLGDSYAAARGGTHQPAETLGGGINGRTEDGERVNRSRHDGYNPSRNAKAFGLKHKDLVGIPWRVALALQADGWYLRSDIIWHKPNPMPESVTDRPTKAHEYLYLLTKSPRYYYDSEAIKEADAGRPSGNCEREVTRQPNNRGPATGVPWEPDGTGRNARSVFTINTRAYPDAHFAVFPPALPERCIKAATRPTDVVLDPFSGAGTTGMVARRLQRRYIGIEQNPKYADMSRRRIDHDAPLFNR